MSILETIKGVMIRRKRELIEQADGLRSAGKFIDAAIAYARESEIRFAINTIKDHESFFPGDGAKSDQQESAAAPDVPVEWQVAEKYQDGGLFMILLEKTAFFCGRIFPGDKYIKLPGGTQPPSVSLDAPRWEKHDGEEANEPVFIRDKDMFVYYKGFRLNLDKAFGFLPKNK